jgi:hypothetical protein
MLASTLYKECHSNSAIFAEESLVSLSVWQIMIQVFTLNGAEEAGV